MDHLVNSLHIECFTYGDWLLGRSQWTLQSNSLEALRNQPMSQGMAITEAVPDEGP
jgi:hypothetical protein